MSNGNIKTEMPMYFHVAGSLQMEWIQFGFFHHLNWFSFFLCLSIVPFNIEDKNSKNVPSSITNCEKWNAMGTCFYTITICIIFKYFSNPFHAKNSFGFFVHVHALSGFYLRKNLHDDDKTVFFFPLTTVYECNQIWFIGEEEANSWMCFDLGMGHATRKRSLAVQTPLSSDRIFILII